MNLALSQPADWVEQLRVLIEPGIPLTPRPFHRLAQQLNVEESAVIAQIRIWQQAGLIKRFGMVVKHRQLGYTANAMVVWNIPDQDVDRVAKKLASAAGVTLCYRRPRVLPHWPYNLFCMIHGQCRQAVLDYLDQLVEQHQLQQIEKSVLFSNKAYKQRGARYRSKKGVNHGN